MRTCGLQFALLALKILDLMQWPSDLVPDMIGTWPMGLPYFCHKEESTQRCYPLYYTLGRMVWLVAAGTLAYLI